MQLTSSIPCGARSLRLSAPAPRAITPRSRIISRANAGTKEGAPTNPGFATMRDGIKVAADESMLTPRFYTTDFAEMEEMFSLEKNPDLPMEELTACLKEFQRDYNQRHFVRNETFKKAADNITGETRKIFIEFLERSCTAEFSGFLLYKELGRRLKHSNPAVAEIFTLLSRDEARHAGFINKAMSDFNLALDLGFLTKNRKYTFFKPKFIVYATFLSEKIGYWRYICIYRHLQRNPDNQLYPLFEYFENWCQDESRHGDFLDAVFKARPELINDNEAKLWSRFFCLSVYITMYLNDHQRTAFYESLGMETTKFNQHVIIETNKTTARIFPQVPDVEHPSFFPAMDKLVRLNKANIAIKSNKSIPGPLRTLMALPGMIQMFAIMLGLFFAKPIDCGTYDAEGVDQSQLVY
eukprot:gene1364-32727_t